MLKQSIGLSDIIQAFILLDPDDETKKRITERLGFCISTESPEEPSPIGIVYSKQINKSKEPITHDGERITEPPAFEEIIVDDHDIQDIEIIPEQSTSSFIPQWLVNVKPLDIDSETVKPKIHTKLISLINPRQTRTILFDSIAVKVKEGKIDLNRLTEMLAKGRFPIEIPRYPVRTIRKGFEVYMDKSESMDPYKMDQILFLSQLKSLMPDFYREVFFFKTTPMWIYSRWDILKRRFSFSRHRKPVILLTDFGIGKPLYADDNATVPEWQDFLYPMVEKGFPITVFIPYKHHRIPSVLYKKGIQIIEWDRTGLKQPYPVKPVEPPENNQELAEIIKTVDQDILKFAKLLSPAVRVEQELMREVRLRFFPEAGAGIEADVWFSSLVESRSSLGIVLKIKVLQFLRKELKKDDDKLIDQLWELIKDFRERVHTSIVIQLEEKLNYLSLYAKGKTNKEINTIFSRIMKSIVDGEQKGLCKWFLHISHRLPDSLKDSDTLKTLTFIAKLHDTNHILSEYELPVKREDYEGFIDKILERTEIGIRCDSRNIEFSYPPARKAFELEIPKTNPLFIFLLKDGGSEEIVKLKYGEKKSKNRQKFKRIRFLDGYGFRVQKKVQKGWEFSPSSIRILHLSCTNFRATEKDPVRSFNADVVTKSMLYAIEKLVSEEATIDLVIITGDIAFSGKKAEYDVAEQFFNRLREVTGLPNSRFYIVPGNHDIDREIVRKRYVKTWYAFDSQDDITDILTDKHLFPILMKKYAEYNTFANIILGRRLFTEKDYSYVKSLTIRKENKAFSLNLLGLNSALFAGYDGDDKQKLAFGLHQVEPALSKCDENALFTIVFFHHPFSCFHPKDKVVENIIKQNADILLHGHLHEPLNAVTIDAAGKLVTIGAGAWYEQREYKNSFNLIEIDPFTGKGSVFFYKYTHEHNNWQKNYDVNPHSKDGRFSFTLESKDLDKKIIPVSAGYTEPEEEDFTTYLTWLKEECGYIDIRGLQVGSGKAHRFEINRLYIPLTTSSRIKEINEHSRKGMDTEKTISVPLSTVLEHQYVTIIGDPGSGKTTFIRYIASTFGNALTENDPGLVKDKTGLQNLLFPVFIRVSELTEFILHHKAGKNYPSLDTDPRWIVFFLNDKNTALKWGFSPTFFDNKLKTGTCLLLLDGLDEAPDRIIRQKISSLVKNTIQANIHCRFVITTRPLAYTGLTVLKDFTEFTIASLSEKAVHSFLKLWSETLFSGNLVKTSAENHYKDLAESLSRSQAIRRLALNPMMLTALAVIHWNQRRLPEQRAELYESIITWLLRSREYKPGRLTAEQCKPYLCKLAFAMQADPRGRQVQVGRKRACEILEELFSASKKEERLALAEDFIEHEEVDSGIIVQRGGAVAFWHLTFQEYLTARALGGKADEEQKRLLIKEEVLLSPDWKEVLLLLCGVLHEQGLDKIGKFFKEILLLQKGKKDLTDKARFFGLLGAMEHDLSPYQYEIDDPLYDDLKNKVMAVFDKDKALQIPVDIRCDAANALGQAGDPRFLIDQFVTIPGGEFLMGAQKDDLNAPNYDPSAWDDESPIHKVSLTEYQISKYPVTVGEYTRFIEDGGYIKEKYWEAGGFGKFTEPDEWVKQEEFPTRPVVGIRWFEAMAYAAWKGCTLPTEAQWERAARGPGEKYRIYPWGNKEPDEHTVNWNKAGLGHPSPVGIFPLDQTEEGVYDMAGNAGEWCMDRRDVPGDAKKAIFYEQSDGSNDPLNDETGKWGKVGNTGKRVIRGGSWDSNNERYLRCSYRFFAEPTVRDYNIGFRIVRSIS